MKFSQHRSSHFHQDFLLQYSWYLEKAGEEVAEQYLAALNSTLERLVNKPDLGRLRSFRHPDLAGLRSFCLNPPFAVHLVFYRQIGPDIFFERLIPGMRDLPRHLRQMPGEN